AYARSELSAVEERLNRQVQRIQDQQESLLDSALRPLRAQVEALHTRVSELGGSVKGVEDGLDAHVRRAEAADAQLRGWRRSLEEGLRSRPAEAPAAAPPRGAVTRQDLGDVADVLRRELRKMVGDLAADDGCIVAIARREAVGALEPLRRDFAAELEQLEQELRRGSRGDASAAQLALTTAQQEDLARAAEGLRHELREVVERTMASRERAAFPADEAARLGHCVEGLARRLDGLGEEVSRISASVASAGAQAAAAAPAGGGGLPQATALAGELAQLVRGAREAACPGGGDSRRSSARSSAAAPAGEAAAMGLADKVAGQVDVAASAADAAAAAVRDAHAAVTRCQARLDEVAGEAGGLRAELAQLGGRTAGCERGLLDLQRALTAGLLSASQAALRRAWRPPPHGAAPGRGPCPPARSPWGCAEPGGDPARPPPGPALCERSAAAPAVGSPPRSEVR
ncbi:unnamed protein product, partial [Prorocentrum cordatum]